MTTHNPAQLFATCLVDTFYPQVGFATAQLLTQQGFQVEFPPKQTCCGQPAFNAGHIAEAQAMARHTLDVLTATHGPIILPSGSCTDMIVHHYPEILAADPVYAPQAQAVAQRTFELTQFLVDQLGVTQVGASCAGCATYHPSCHGLRNLQLRTQAQQLLHHVQDLELVELPEAETCCGFGGLFAIKMSDISGAMMNRKLDNVTASGATLLVGSDVSCLMHLAGGLQKRGQAIQVKHIAEILSPPPPPVPPTTSSWLKPFVITLATGLGVIFIIKRLSRKTK